MKLTNPTEWSRLRRGVALALGTGLLAGLLALTAVALWPESSAQAKQNFCNSLTNLSGTVMSYEGLDPATATSEQRDNAYHDISDAWNRVVDDANDWANAYDNPLNQAYDDLYWAIEFLPGDYTVAESLDALQPELSAFPEAFHETFDGSGCATA
jgi:hypothetical protein